MMNRKQKISFASNCLIFVFTVFATVSMMIGFAMTTAQRHCERSEAIHKRKLHRIRQILLYSTSIFSSVP